ncbi:lipid A deacylase LpxR family protein [uncultured Polaribacter sp.]|uniref:lipid A deacylase LpxR family protein n=1 Tax=uncultured Polaribacter sp. TaxID=174711 RepID=UPI002628B311|nr:lipid A deacylase LpxR family protein [uncultured Polaribacter sp.]
MKNIILVLFIFFSCLIFSQEKFSKEISLLTDNDLYVSSAKDRYYTSGIYLKYSYLTKHNNNLDKKIFEWQIGHKMYTPYKAVVLSLNEHDRPFAGYLYGSFGINRIYKTSKNLKTTLQIGTIGSNAFGKELQDFIHNIYSFSKAIGWEYQIKNAFGLNFNTEFNSSLLKENNNNFDITWMNAAQIGTVFTNISSGFYTRIGLKPLQKLMNSIAFNTHLNNNKTQYKKETESFIYLKTLVAYNLYDATIQGSFLNKNSLVTKELIPLVFNLELGIKFTANKFNFGYSYLYNTNKSKDLRYNKGNSYGSIAINYLLK